MKVSDFGTWLNLGRRNRLPTILQGEATECGLACVAMIAYFYGFRSDLATLRQRFSISLKGVRLSALIDIANRLKFGTRAIRLELSDLSKLRLPCILHWSFDHFVVLKSVGPKTVTIIDPARGERSLSYEKVSRAFTGVALEMWPNPGFQPSEMKQAVSVRGLLGHVTGLYRSLGQVLLLALTLEVFAVVSPFYMQWVVDNVLVSGDRQLLTTLALGFGLLMLFQQFIAVARSWVLIYMGVTLNVQLRANVFSHLLRLPGSYFEKRHLGDITSRFGSIDAIQRTLTASFVEAILDGLVTVVTLVVIFLYSPLLAWITIGTMAIYVLGRWLWYRPLRAATEEQIVYAATQQSHFLETVRGVKTIKLFQGQLGRRASWLTLLVDQVNADVRTQKLLLLFRSLNGTLFGLEGVLTVWLGARAVLDGGFTTGMLIAFMAYKSQFATRVSSLTDKFFEVKMMRLQAERLADIVLSPPEDVEGNHRLVSSDRGRLEPSIAVVDLKFQYAEHEPEVLSEISFSVAAGEALAITGPSGGGKSTLLNIMAGMLPPTSGTISIGGVDMEKLGSDVFRSMVATVTQDDTLFEGSLADNISFFDSSADLEWVQECAQRAAIHEDIVAMSMGYNTRVGYLGSVLSAGQKQRVLLARALYKRPKILLLDEATSHLDLQREIVVASSIRAMNITRVIVAHRPQTLEAADRVIRLEGGRLSNPSEMRGGGGTHVSAVPMLEEGVL